MPEKTESVYCPWCGYKFTVKIPARYKGARALCQQDDNLLPKGPGEDIPCPNPKCPHQLFIQWLK
jgi:hypothetical protein